MEIEKKYKKMDQIEHILKRPGMYIGGIEEKEESSWIVNQDNKMEKRTIKYSPGIYKIFDEIITNSLDETFRGRNVNLIMVNYDQKSGWISVCNDGIGIDVVVHPKYKIYVPELIFGHLLTSTNYDDSEKRLVAGVHGLGAKLTAIFSKEFVIEIGDTVNKKAYKQVFKNSLSEKSKPKVTTYNKSTGYVKISFLPDYKYFKYSGMTDDLTYLIRKRTYDIAGCSSKNIKVYLNKEKLSIRDFNDYVNLYPIDKEFTISEVCNDKWSVIICKSPNDKYEQISFVNGTNTSNGGRHVDHIINQYLKNITEKVNKKFKRVKIKESFLKDQLWVFINSSVVNPVFSSQTKEELITNQKDFGEHCILSERFFKKLIDKFSLYETIQQEIRLRERKDLEKTDAKKKSRLRIPKLEDAIYAGTSKSSQCTLILTEGDSAKATAISGISALSHGRKTYGVFPLKGKLLNVRESNNKQITENSEFTNIKQILGLRNNMEYNRENVSTLRYGSVLLMMDADADGSHIKGLFLNMIEYFWPSLLKIKGFVKSLVTPVVKATKNKEVKSFYTLQDFDKWSSSNNVTNWNIKYYKGLGTNTPSEAREYFKEIDKHQIEYIWDASTKENINLGFNKKKANDRKTWLKKYDNNLIIPRNQKEVTVSEFVNRELIHFSNYDNIRSIPNAYDGLKVSQRKVLYACFEKKLNTDVKVSQLVGYIGEKTAYHHGENSLINTVINMAQDFIGSNNINLLLPKGQFGTRLKGGKDHSSARYIFTMLNAIAKNIFHEDDSILLDYVEDDGKKIEPKYYVPVIPMVLVNGCEGIGTGYNTFVPCFSPKDIIDNIKRKLKGEKMHPMIPWYNNFKGRTEKKDDYNFICYGTYQLNNNGIQITELPIGVWTEDYKLYLEDLLDKKKIGKVDNYSTDTEINIHVKVDNINSIDINTLFKLSRNINISNMNLYNINNEIINYNSPLKIIEDFFKIRIKLYEKRKEYLISKVKNQLKIYKARVKFIEGVISKEINISKQSKEELLKFLRKKLFHKMSDTSPDKEYDYLIKMPMYSMTTDKVKELKDKYKITEKELKQLEKRTIQEFYLNDLELINI